MSLTYTFVSFNADYEYMTKKALGLLVLVVALVFPGQVNAEAYGENLEVETFAATNGSIYSSLYGKITDSAASSISQRGFEYGLDTSYGQSVYSPPTSKYFYDRSISAVDDNADWDPSYRDLAVDSNGNVFVTDLQNQRIQIFDGYGNYLGKFGTAGSGFGELGYIVSIAIDSQDFVYVSSYTNQVTAVSRISKFDNEGNFITEWPTMNISESGYEIPVITVDSNDVIYASGISEIVKYSTAGTVLDGFSNLAGDDVDHSTTDITVDSQGNVYTINSYRVDTVFTSRMKKFDAEGNYTGLWANDYVSSLYPIFGSSPVYGLLVGPDNNIYLSKAGGYYLAILDTDGNVLDQLQVQEKSYPTPTIDWSNDIAFWASGKIDIADNGAIYMSNYSQIERLTPANEFPIGNYVATMGPLECGQTYHYRAFATDSLSTSYGEDMTFVTEDCEETSATASPESTTVSAESLSPFEARLTGRVGSDGFTSDTFSYETSQLGFEYGLTTSYGETYQYNSYVYTAKMEQVIGKQGEWSYTTGNGNGEFAYPRDIYVDSVGNWYVADTQNNRIQKFDSEGNHILSFGEPGPGEGQLSSPRAVLVDQSGVIYVADSGNLRIQKFDSEGNYDSQFTYDPGYPYSFSPTSIALDDEYNLYVANGNEVYKFDTNNDLVFTIGGNGPFSSGAGFDNGEFAGISGIAVDSENNLYVADSLNHRYQKFDSEGNHLQTVGTGGPNKYNLSYINDIYIGQDGNVYAITHENISIFNTEGEFISGILPGNLDSNGFSGVSIFTNSRAIAVTAGGDLLIAGDSSTLNRLSHDEYSLYSAQINGLDCETTYHYRSFAINNQGSSYGEDQTFTTGECPPDTLSLDVELQNLAPVKSGDNVDFEISINNDHTEAITLSGSFMFMAFIPAEFTFISNTNSSLACLNAGLVSDQDTSESILESFGNRYAIMCSLTEAVTIPTGNSLVFSLIGSAISDFTNNSTNLFSITIDENDYFDMLKIMSAFQGDGDLTTIESNNIFNYVYTSADNNDNNNDDDTNNEQPPSSIPPTSTTPPRKSINRTNIISGSSPVSDLTNQTEGNDATINRTRSTPRSSQAIESADRLKERNGITTKSALFQPTFLIPIFILIALAIATYYYLNKKHRQAKLDALETHGGSFNDFLRK